MKEVLMRYTDLTGKPAQVPQWTFGLWLSTSFTTNYDEETVMSFIDGMLERNIPLQVFHFDCFWMKEFHWSDFTWDSRVFPDPAGMLKRIHEKGFKICVWINPYIGQESCLFAEGMEKGYFVRRTIGSVLGEEARGRGKDVILGPGINIKRSPLCGRNFEYFSEDPYLTGEMAAAYIKGVQLWDVAACVKHFAVNNQETQRLWVEIEIDEQSLREIYFPAFYNAIKQGWSFNSYGGL